MKLVRSTMALGAFFVLCVALAGCGSGVPGNAVADVAGNPITTQAFNHWLYLAAKNQAAQTPGAPIVVPTDPPKYTDCIASLRSQLPALQSTATKTLRTGCAQQFQQLAGPVLDSLITAYWYQAQAARMHLTVSSSQVMKTFLAAKQQGFPSDAQFQAYLSQSGLTLQDILFRFRVNALFSKLIAKHSTTVTPAQIQAYYNSHLTQFSTPQTRDIRIVLTSTPAQALTAETALKSGKSWNAVAAKYSIDPTSKNKGGLLVNVTQGQQDQALDSAAFAAPQGKLLGPVHGQFGYYVLEVTKITPAARRSLAQVAALIRQNLTTQLANSAQSAINAQARKQWLSTTTCRAQYAMSDCSGYKKPKGSTTGVG